MTFDLRFQAFLAALTSIRPRLSVRIEPPAVIHRQRILEADQALAVRMLSKRLSPRLLRDVLGDRPGNDGSH